MRTEDTNKWEDAVKFVSYLVCTLALDVWVEKRAFHKIVGFHIAVY